MIKEMSKSFRLCRYAYGLKSNLWLAAVIFTGGVLSSFLIPAGSMNRWVGSFLILALPMCHLQMLYSLGASLMVQSAPMQKKLETTVPVVINLLYGLFGYALIILIKGIQVKTGMYAADEVPFQLLISAGVMLLVDFYSGIAYKKYYLGTVLFFLCAMVYGGLSGMGTYLGWGAKVHPAAAACVGIAALFLGAALQYGLSLLVYKAPMDKSAQLPGLRKRM